MRTLIYRGDRAKTGAKPRLVGTYYLSDYRKQFAVNNHCNCSPLIRYLVPNLVVAIGPFSILSPLYYSGLKIVQGDRDPS